jgi:hypothetical protein
MSRHLTAKRLVGLGGACLLGFLVIGHFSSEDAAPQRQGTSTDGAASRPTSRSASEAAAPAAGSVGGQPAPGVVSEGAAGVRPAPLGLGPLPEQQGASAPDAEREAALRQRLATAAQVISVPASGRAPPRPGIGPGGAAPTLSPQLESQRRAALSGWQREAQALLNRCVERPSQLRQPVALEVAFAPRPRAQGDSRQVLTPDWILVPPHELQRLWQHTDPQQLQHCLDRARGLALTVQLSGDALAQEFPLFAESVLVQL